MRDTFVTIDLDYWNCSYDKDSYCLDYAKKDLEYIFKKINLMDIDTSVVKYHHHVLKYTKQYNIKTLINVDFHSDIVNVLKEDLPDFKICEGSWGNYVTTSKFIWIHPYKDIIDGMCHNDKKQNPFYKRNQGRFGVKTVLKKQGTVYDINWKKINHVNFCISPDWTAPDIQKYAKKFFKENGIKI